jgi:hypothetical protein
MIDHKFGGVATVADIVELRPSRGAPLKPSTVVQDFTAVLRRHGAGHLRADGHYREAIREHLDAARLELLSAPEGSNGKLPDVRPSARPVP